MFLVFDVSANLHQDTESNVWDRTEYEVFWEAEGSLEIGDEEISVTTL